MEFYQRDLALKYAASDENVNQFLATSVKSFKDENDGLKSEMKKMQAELDSCKKELEKAKKK